MKVYIYGLIDPQTNKIRYIGKTNNCKRRLQGHIDATKNRKFPVYAWIKSLLEKNLTPSILILETVDEQVWKEKEIYWIAKYKKEWNLLNIHKGGNIPMVSTEKRSKLTKAMWQNADLKRKLRKSMSKARVKMWQQPEYRAKRFSIMSDKWKDPIYKEKHINSFLNTISTAEYKKRDSEKKKKMWQSTEYRQKRAESLRKNWADPAYRLLRKQKKAERALALSK